jgi:Flp pilus assembly protein CpaB
MANYANTRREPSRLGMFAFAALVLVLGAAGAVGGMWAAGMVELPFMRAPEPSRVGMVKVPLSVRLIPAYKMIRRDDLINPQTGTWLETWASEKDVAASKIVVDPAKIIGRVVSADKGPLFSFTENDFMPAGTRPGLVAGIPPGKRSLTLASVRLDGIQGLQMGDRFDIVATLPAEKEHSALRNVRGLDGLPTPEPRVRVLVDNGAIVSPVHVRDEVSTTNSLTKGQRSSMKPVEEVVIALEPDEIPRLTAAMSQNAAILVVARSGHPDDAKIESITPESNPPPPPTMIETVVGDKRETIFFRSAPAHGETMTGPQRPALSPVMPRDKLQQLPSRNLPQVGDETAFAPLKTGSRVAP